MKQDKREFPLRLNISFEKLFEAYRKMENSGSSHHRERAAAVLGIAKKHPKLSTGLKTKAEIREHAAQIDFVLGDLFPAMLGDNEIKIATAPFQEQIFKATQRYKDIINATSEGFKLSLSNFTDDEFYIMGCSMILRFHFGYNVDFTRSFHYKIPDAQGVDKWYKVLYNGQFVSIEKTPESLDITDGDVQQLIDGFEDVSLWKEKFPPYSWKFSGFVIASLFDITTDVSLSNFKENLLNPKADKANFTQSFENILRSLYKLPDLKVGFSLFNAEDDNFEKPETNITSYVLAGQTVQNSREALCRASHYTLFKNNGFYCVSDVANSHDLYPENPLYPKLLEQGVRSAIIIPMVVHDQMYGLLEIVSTTSRALNSINANKLHDMLPHFSDSVKREKEREENEVELLIQEECTSIHSSVHWKFRREAKRVLKAQKAGAQAFFSEVVFENVHPLFGQMDIKGSSQARNEATVRDLTQQLEHVKQIISQISTIEKLPIYDQLNFRVSEYLEKFNEELQVNSENQVLEFLRTEIVPLFSHLSEKGEGLKTLIKEYYNLIDMTSGLIYKHRKAYDETVMQINKRMAGIIDSKQREAQKMYPHYFERYKTDGVEHSMYVGGSISQSSPFHKIYLHNLRLWQLQVMCEMETHYYKIKEELPLDLEVASMILAFSGTLSLRFRMDEKRFDVDGTYNARYEVVKKRVDKANIKGTDERITQAGKIAVIYSQKEDEDEYLKYIRYLQQKNMLDTDEELLELEDLQGVTGLRAIRVSVLYTKNRDNTKEYYTYEDLIQQISG